MLKKITKVSSALTSAKEPPSQCLAFSLQDSLTLVASQKWKRIKPPGSQPFVPAAWEALARSGERVPKKLFGISMNVTAPSPSPGP